MCSGFLRLIALRCDLSSVALGRAQREQLMPLHGPSVGARCASSKIIRLDRLENSFSKAACSTLEMRASNETLLIRAPS